MPLEIKDGKVYRDGKEVKTYDQHEIDQIIDNRLKNEKDKIRKEVEDANKVTLDELKTKAEAADLKVTELESKIEEAGQTEEELAKVKVELQTARAEKVNLEKDYTKQLEEENTKFKTEKAEKLALKAETELAKLTTDIINPEPMIKLMVLEGTAKYNEEDKLEIDGKPPDEWVEEWKKENPNKVASNQKQVPATGENGGQQVTTENERELLKEVLKDGIPIQ